MALSVKEKRALAASMRVMDEGSQRKVWDSKGLAYFGIYVLLAPTSKKNIPSGHYRWEDGTKYDGRTVLEYLDGEASILASKGLTRLP